MDSSPPQPSRPEVLDRRLTFLLRRVTDAAARLANAALAPLGIGVRHYAVLAVLEATGAPSQRTIADTLSIDRATVVALVDDLEEQGLVQRTRSRQDRRANAVRLTEEGQQLLERAHALMDSCEQSFLETLPLAERAQLAAGLERLLAASSQEV
jgi:DNA-binding MarR family transcriptional regulator